MATFTKFNAYLEYVFEKILDHSADSFKVWLSNTAPAATDGLLANITEIAYTFCSSRVLTITSSGQVSGTYKWVVQDLVLTASGGVVGPFRYYGIYDDTPVSPADPNVGYWDHGASVTLQNGDSATLNFDDTNGVLQAA